MASTRAATGNSKPRVFQAVSTAPTRKTTSTGRSKKRATGTTKGKKPTGVTKTKTTAAPRKRKTSVKDKVGGAVKKAVGTVERKPGKKAAGTKKMRGTDGKGVAKV